MHCMYLKRIVRIYGCLLVCCVCVLCVCLCGVVYICMCVCVCVCAHRGRERERERDLGREGMREEGRKREEIPLWERGYTHVHLHTMAHYMCSQCLSVPQINLERVHNNHTCSVLLWALSLSVFIALSLQQFIQLTCVYGECVEFQIINEYS